MWYTVTVRIGYSVGALGGGLSPDDHAYLAQEAERIGYDSVWAAEIFGTDPVGLLSWLAAKTSRITLGSAVLQIPARSAVTTAATAATLQRLSRGRFRLGLGASSPQIAEGWHGVSFNRPLDQVRDYVAVLRLALAGRPVEYAGRTITLPTVGGQATPAALIGMARVPPIPLYLAGIGPHAVRLAGELADGWLAIHCSPDYITKAHSLLAEGAVRSERSLTDFDICVMIQVLVEEDLELARDMMRPSLAFYLGGMGSKTTNFYNRLATQLGYSAAAKAVKDAYGAGQVDEAMMALPDELVDSMTICGPPDRVREKLAEYRDAGTTTLIAGVVGSTRQARHEQLGQLAGLTDLGPQG
jgi:F420-dependent oxidoreductase-like protein